MFKSIVWATDGSDYANKALPYVKELAREGGAAITIVHVVERIEGAGAIGLPRRADEGEIQAQLKTLAAEFSEEGFSVSLKIRGDVGARPAHEIVNDAREAGADLIVAGTRGHSAIAGLLLGSVTQRLLHVAPCPVLVVPANEPERASGRPSLPRPHRRGNQ